MLCDCKRRALANSKGSYSSYIILTLEGREIEMSALITGMILVLVMTFE